MLLPHHVGLFRVFVPVQTVGHPTCCDHVGSAVMVDIDCPLSAVGDELANDLYGPILVPFPLTALRAWILIPKSATQEIRSTVAVHVERSDSLSVIVTEL